MPLTQRVSRMAIRFSLQGCTNRPFYHIVVMSKTKGRDEKVTEQIGSYDPLPNLHNERLIAINFQKLRHWIGKGAVCSTPVEILLGYAGFFPIHPRTRLQAYRVQRKKEEQKTKTQPEALDEQTDESKNS